MSGACWPAAVLLVITALCLDSEHALSLSRRGNAAFLRKRQWKNGFGFRDIVERKVKRSEESVGESCHSLQDYDTRLQENTHTVSRIYCFESAEHAVLLFRDG